MHADPVRPTGPDGGPGIQSPAHPTRRTHRHRPAHRLVAGRPTLGHRVTRRYGPHLRRAVGSLATRPSVRRRHGRGRGLVTGLNPHSHRRPRSRRTDLGRRIRRAASVAHRRPRFLDEGGCQVVGGLVEEQRVDRVAHQPGQLDPAAPSVGEFPPRACADRPGRTGRARAASVNSPLSKRSCRAMSLSSVDFPEPLSPMTPTFSPGLTVRLTWSSTTWSPYRLVMSWRVSCDVRMALFPCSRPSRSMTVDDVSVLDDVSVRTVRGGAQRGRRGGSGRPMGCLLCAGAGRDGGVVGSVVR